MIVELLNIIIPVILCAAVGFGWVRFGFPFETGFVTTLVANVAAPCLIVVSLTRLDVGLGEIGKMAGAAALAILIFGAIGTVVLKLMRLPLHTFLGPLMFANTGNMGIPLCLFAFGQTGLSLAIAVFAVNAFAQFTLGTLIASGEISLKRLARTPLIYAVLIALAIAATGTEMPTAIRKTLDLLGDIAIGLMLLALGASLASLEIGSLRRSFALAVLRLGMGAAVGFGLAALLGFEGAARGVLVVECAMPAAVFTYLFAHRHGREADQVAGIVMLSTLMAFATIPALLSVLL